MLTSGATHLKVRSCPYYPHRLKMAVMKAVIEVRTYRAKSSKRELLLDLLRRRAFPLQRRLGMKILGPFPSQEDDVTFVWLRGFPDEASRDPLKAAFYEGADWQEGLGLAFDLGGCVRACRGVHGVVPVAVELVAV